MTDPRLLRTFTSYGRRAGSARVRVFDWLDHLNVHASSATFLGTADNSAATLGRNAGRTISAQSRLIRAGASGFGGTTLISRQATPLSRGGIEASLLARSARGVYDFDDAIMLPRSGALERLWPKSQIWHRSVAAADAVIAGNDYLAEHAERFSRNVVVIPSCVEPSHYIPKSDYSIRGNPRALWLGSPSTEHYLQLIAPSLLHANQKFGLRLTVISAGSNSLGALEPISDRIQWNPSTVADDLASADFGIMPLDDSAWTRGKCAYKLLQYGAAALPLVGSPVGANERVLNLAGGLSPETNDDWYASFETLIAMGDEQRSELGRKARVVVEDGYSFSAWASAWRSVVSI